MVRKYALLHLTDKIILILNIILNRFPGFFDQFRSCYFFILLTRTKKKRTAGILFIFGRSGCECLFHSLRSFGLSLRLLYRIRNFCFLDQFRFQQSPVYGFKDGIINLLLPREAKLHLCRMHIDIYIFSTQMKMQNCKWKLVLHHKITISVFHGFGDHCTFDITAVYEEIFKVAISTCDDRLAEKTCDMDTIFLIIDLNQVSCHITAIDIVDHIFQFSISGSTQFFLSVIQKLKSNFRMRQGKVHQEILHMSGFCHWRFQKFSSRRNIVK